MSCELLILVDEPAEAVAPSDLVDVDWRVVGEWTRGSSLVQGAVRRMTVHRDEAIEKLVLKHWGKVRGATTAKMREQIARYERVVRGGSYYNRASVVRSAYRYYGLPADRNDDVGLRPARTFR